MEKGSQTVFSLLSSPPLKTRYRQHCQCRGAVGLPYFSLWFYTLNIMPGDGFVSFATIQVSVALSTNETRPGDVVHIKVKAATGSCVCIATVDKSVYLLKTGFQLTSTQVRGGARYQCLLSPCSINTCPLPEEGSAEKHLWLWGRESNICLLCIGFPGACRVWCVRCLWDFQGGRALLVARHVFTQAPSLLCLPLALGYHQRCPLCIYGEKDSCPSLASLSSVCVMHSHC